MDVKGWQWKKHVSKTSGKEMLKVEYKKNFYTTPVAEYLLVLHDGFVGHESRRTIRSMIQAAGSNDFDKLKDIKELDSLVDYLNKLPPPKEIEHKIDGGYHRILQRVWL